MGASETQQLISSDDTPIVIPEVPKWADKLLVAGGCIIFLGAVLWISLSLALNIDIIWVSIVVFVFCSIAGGVMIVVGYHYNLKRENALKRETERKTRVALIFYNKHHPIQVKIDSASV